MDIEVEEPDDDSELGRGDLVNVELNVENTGDDDIDGKVKAIFYNNDNAKRLDNAAISKSINEDDEERITFDLEMGNNVDKGDQLTLYIKVYDEDHALDSCTVKEISLDVEIPDHKLTVENVVLNPTTLACGGSVSGSALVRNTGSNDEDVVVEIYNRNLGINVLSSTFELEEEKDQLINFNFLIPSDAPAGAHQIFVNANYNDEEDALGVGTLTIVECDTSSQDNEDADSLGTLTGRAAGVDATDYTEKSFFDMFNKPSNTLPAYVWVLLTIIVVLVIIGLLVWIFKSR